MIIKNKKECEIPGHVILSSDQQGSPKILVETAVSTAEIYLKGAHVTSFQKKGEAPLFFASEVMQGEHGKIIHGGIPLCFPWFGAHEGEKKIHGFARDNEWELVETRLRDNGAVELLFTFPEAFMIDAGWSPVKTELRMTIFEALTFELMVTNTTEADFIFEECFHPYFFIGDIKKVFIQGLHGHDYLDKTEDLIRKQETSDKISIVSETNRIYLKSEGLLEIHDGEHQRLIQIQKTGSASTVVWNPWIQRSKIWPDLNDDDYQKFVCVESGNVAESRKKLAPGESSSLKVVWNTKSL